MNMKQKHLLIIDDDSSVLSVFGQYFEAKGFSVDRAEDGREAMVQLRRHRPDLIITDILMPDKDGLEVLREVRADFADLPVIAISGGMRNASMNVLSIARQFGACKVLEKPVELATIMDAVRELLDAEGDAD